MDSSERVRKAIHFQGPDRSPISHAVLPAAQLKYGKELLDILAEYRDDFGWDHMSDLPVEDYPVLYRAGRNVDSFGTVWHSETLGVCGIPIEWPIKEIGEIDAYSWPDDFSAGPPEGRQYSGHMVGRDGRSHRDRLSSRLRFRRDPDQRRRSTRTGQSVRRSRRMPRTASQLPWPSGDRDRVQRGHRASPGRQLWRTDSASPRSVSSRGTCHAYP